MTIFSFDSCFVCFNDKWNIPLRLEAPPCTPPQSPALPPFSEVTPVNICCSSLLDMFLYFHSTWLHKLYITLFFISRKLIQMLYVSFSNFLLFLDLPMQLQVALGYSLKMLWMYIPKYIYSSFWQWSCFQLFTILNNATKNILIPVGESFSRIMWRSGISGFQAVGIFTLMRCWQIAQSCPPTVTLVSSI